MSEFVLLNGTNEQAKNGFCSVVFAFGRAWVRNERTNTPLKGGGVRSSLYGHHHTPRVCSFVPKVYQTNGGTL